MLTQITIANANALTSSMDKCAADLLSDLLALDPAKRLTAEEALEHRWFHVDPAPATPHE